MTDALKEPTKTPETTAFSYERGIAINVGTEEAREWLEVRFSTAHDPKREPKTQSAPTYDDKGADTTVVVGETWSLNFAVQIHRAKGGGLLDEVEQLRKATEPDATGSKAIVHVMWFDKPANTDTPKADDAYEGKGTVSITRGETGNDGIETWQFTITGNGRRKKIKNPYDPATGKLKFTD